VSGGYRIASSGKVTGGNAGSLNIQGYSVILQGDFRAESLLGNKGGTIAVIAGNIDIAAAGGTLPSTFQARTPCRRTFRGSLSSGRRSLAGPALLSLTSRASTTS